ncbi:DUF2508 family protein [Moorella naiadis]|uniref:DUF2508 family protein n=1 Tax=Moorella naiadis (nom. illeg.) TaxID=3093670 RepID=UPI003D9C8085
MELGLREELAGVAEAIREAREEWLAAQRFFAEVTEPELVDQAIFRLEAAERRYMYLWKVVRNQGKALGNPLTNT